MSNLENIKKRIENGEEISRDELRKIAKELKVPKWYEKTKDKLKIEILMSVNGLIKFKNNNKNNKEENMTIKEKELSMEWAKKMAENEEEEREKMENENIADAEYGEDETKMEAIEAKVGEWNTLTTEEEEKDIRTKDSYIDNIEIGMIIAFNIARGKAMSAKVISIDSENNMYLCKAIDGTPYKVPRSTIIWVKTGKRWPRGIFEKLLAGSSEVIRYAEKAE